MSVLDELAEAEGRVASIKQRIASEHCSVVGHDWASTGGKNAGCGRDCGCSVPVNVCRKCGDRDYGDNAEARETIRACRQEAIDRADEDWFFDMDGKP